MLAFVIYVSSHALTFRNEDKGSLAFVTIRIGAARVQASQRLRMMVMRPRI